jgi:mono/diheme cytochrome c family protein
LANPFTVGVGKRVALALLLSFSVATGAPAGFSITEAKAVIQKSCVACHQGKEPSGKFDLAKFDLAQPVSAQAGVWQKILTRVRNGDMPPATAPPLEMDARQGLTAWIERELLTAACAGGMSPGPWPLRRLNRNEYAATVRDLLNIHFNAGHALPADGAGGEGFDNAAETLFLSPMHAEKYLEAARSALAYAASDTRARARFFNIAPDGRTPPEEAARKLIEQFLRRAFRRPVSAAEVDRNMALYTAARKRRENHERSVFYALQSALISPHFLFRLEEPNSNPDPRPAGQYEMASRLSYFLWGTMPDDTLFDLASKGKLQERPVLAEQVTRMLKDARTQEFAERFVEQWLNTRELGRDIKPDAALFPTYYDAELSSAIRYEPILFFQEILAQNLSLLNLIDSNFTILNNRLQRHYGINVQGMRQQPNRANLPENSHRGGLVTMAAVLAVSSYPHRTSPVLRGKWLLEALLGTPPPPPPPDVPALPDVGEGEEPETVRERLTAHRQNPVCASCHNQIDPLGFGLENYDVIGRWREIDSGKPIDSKGQLPDGTIFEGASGLKKALLERKGLFIRNLTTKMLGYALGRGLTLEDQCTVDGIVREVEKQDWSAQALVREIVWSVPFRYQRGTDARRKITSMMATEEERR